MKSAVFYGKHDLRVEDSTKPTVGKRDVNRAIACASTQTIPAAAANPAATESTTTASI